MLSCGQTDYLRHLHSALGRQSVHGFDAGPIRLDPCMSRTEWFRRRMKSDHDLGFGQSRRHGERSRKTGARSTEALHRGLRIRGLAQRRHQSGDAIGDRFGPKRREPSKRGARDKVHKMRRPIKGLHASIPPFVEEGLGPPDPEPNASNPSPRRFPGRRIRRPRPERLPRGSFRRLELPICGRPRHPEQNIDRSRGPG